MAIEFEHLDGYAREVGGESFESRTPEERRKIAAELLLIVREDYERVFADPEVHPSELDKIYDQESPTWGYERRKQAGKFVEEITSSNRSYWDVEVHPEGQTGSPLGGFAVTGDGLRGDVAPFLPHSSEIFRKAAAKLKYGNKPIEGETWLHAFALETAKKGQATQEDVTHKALEVVRGVIPAHHSLVAAVAEQDAPVRYAFEALGGGEVSGRRMGRIAIRDGMREQNYVLMSLPPLGPAE